MSHIPIAKKNKRGIPYTLSEAKRLVSDSTHLISEPYYREIIDFLCQTVDHLTKGLEDIAVAKQTPIDEPVAKIAVRLLSNMAQVCLDTKPDGFMDQA